MEDTIINIALTKKWNNLAELVETMSNKGLSKQDSLDIENALSYLNIEGLTIVMDYVTNIKIKYYCKVIITNLKNQ